MSSTDELDKILGWKECHAEGEGKAVAHAWVDWKRSPDELIIGVNGTDTLRVSIKYRDTGPYLCVEQSPLNKTGESMGACKVAGEMAQRYANILEAHNELGQRLHSARTFLITDEEKARAKAAAAA